MTRRSPRRAAPQSADPSDALFKKVCQVRQLVGLPKLRPDHAARELAAKFAQTGAEPALPSAPDHTVISHVNFRDKYAGEPVEALLDAWLWDPGKRPVLLAPGNIGAAQISGGFVAVWVGYAVR